jgi:hypothetical protein
MRKEISLYTTNMYTLKLLLNIVIARIEALVSRNKFLYACVKKVCHLCAQSHFVLWNTKKLCRAIQKKRYGTLTSSVVLLHNNAHLHTVASIWELLEHFNLKLFDHLPYSPDIALSDYHLFTYLKNWLRSQHFNNNEELMEGVKTWLSSQVANVFDTGIKNLFPDATSASIPAVTTLRSSSSMYVFFVHNNIFLSHFLFCYQLTGGYIPNSPCK